MTVRSGEDRLGLRHPDLIYCPPEPFVCFYAQYAKRLNVPFVMKQIQVTRLHSQSPREYRPSWSWVTWHNPSVPDLRPL